MRSSRVPGDGRHSPTDATAHVVMQPATPKRRPQTFVLVLAALLAALAIIQVVSCIAFPDRWNAISRVLDMDSVGWAGIAWDGVDAATTATLKVPCCLRITSVVANGPADTAGVLPGDILIGVNGLPFSDVSEVQADARAFRPGQTVALNVSRNGIPLTLPVVLCSWQTIKSLDADVVSL